MSTRVFCTAVLLLLFLSREAGACSPNLRLDQRAERAAFYAAIQRPPYLLWGLSIAAALLWPLVARRRSISSPQRRWIGAVLVALAVFQPAWWMDSMSGDCGMTRDMSAFAVSMLSVLPIAIGIFRPRALERLTMPRHREQVNS